jgi:pyruvate/2-oxoglutarate dehydrogenase complex dihydrolipoamide dehydrogenase (E3) component
MNHYDVAVIGAGAGGLNISFEALGLGKKVLLIDKNKPGGECTWSGCIPSKALINIADEIHTAKKYGEIEIDTEAILKKVRALIETAHKGESVEVLEAAGITYLNGFAKFKDKNTLDINGYEIKADKIFISTGSSPTIPPIKGLDNINYLTNDNIFLLDKLPKSIIVLGGGAIGVELSQAMNRLGIKVKLVEMIDSILFREEKKLALNLEDILRKEGVEIFTSSKAIEINKDSLGVKLVVEQNGKTKEIIGDEILLALGRTPNLEGLDLEKIGVKFNEKKIEVNEYLETSANGVYAAGDIVGPYLFSHMGGVQGRLALKNAFSVAKEKADYSNAAWCTFTHPELARTGMTESEAREKYGDKINVYTHRNDELDRAIVDEKTEGMSKVICDENGYVIGASILGERACEIICELQVIKTFNLKFSDLQKVIHPYPGYSELLLNMSREA